MLNSLIVLFLALYLVWRLPFWLDALPLWHCGMNWLRFRRWTPCRHAHLTEVSTPLEMGGVASIAEYLCAACGVALVRETYPQRAWSLQDEARADRQRATSARWHTRQERLRNWLAAWVLPLLREYGRFCRFVGFLVVSIGMVLWLAWGSVGEPLLAATFGPPACRQIRLEMFFLEANKQSPCWTTVPTLTEVQR